MADNVFSPSISIQDTPSTSDVGSDEDPAEDLSVALCEEGDSFLLGAATSHYGAAHQFSRGTPASSQIKALTDVLQQSTNTKMPLFLTLTRPSLMYDCQMFILSLETMQSVSRNLAKPSTCCKRMRPTMKPWYRRLVYGY
jgi:hypothetical protein